MTHETYHLEPYSTQHSDLWDAVVSASRNGTFLHLRRYMDYHADRFDERSVLVRKKGKVVAVFPANRVGTQVVSHSGLTYGGLLYGNALRTVDVLEVFRLLARYYRELGIEEILYKAVPHLFHSYPAEEDLYALFRCGAQLYRRDMSAAIKLSTRIKFSDSRKSTIRKAANLGIEIQEGDFFAEFHGLLCQAVAKFGVEPAHSTPEMRLLQSRFPSQIRLFGAFLDGQLLAGALIYDFGRVAHSQYLASSERGKESGALDFVLAHLIEEVFAARDYFSFGISTQDDGRFLNETLAFQKEGFGARGIVHDFYRWALK